MIDQLTINVKGLLTERQPFGFEQAEELRLALNHDPGESTAQLRQAIQLLQQDDLYHGTDLKLRLGIAEYLLSHNNIAETHLSVCTTDALGSFYLGKVQLAESKFSDAEQSFLSAANLGAPEHTCALLRVEALRKNGQLENAETLLDSVVSRSEESAESLYQRSACLMARKDHHAARDLAEKAVDMDAHHIGSLFSIAYANDLLGNDELAIELYEKARNLRPLHIGCLLNLGVLYEDTNEYARAMECYEQILSFYPDHERARLFLKDARASRNMFYDEDTDRQNDRLSQVLNVPVTDFELSVRSRNCLKRINVTTLGDLTLTPEPELLNSKNFGETSLQEIKEMMSSRGLRLGQALETHSSMDFHSAPTELTPEEEALLSKPISELSLSVRARKCMTRLNIPSIGDLVKRSGDELLESKNFGVTSLNEVREKLQIMGLKLRGD